MIDSRTPNNHQDLVKDLAGAKKLVLVTMSLRASENECQQLQQLLAESELERGRRRLEVVRRRSVVSRGRLRLLLGAVLGLPPASVPIGTNAHGKPVLLSSDYADFGFNVCHSGDDGLVALAGQSAVGVDLECRKTSHDAAWAKLMAKTIFDSSEMVRWQKWPEDQWPAAVLDAWVAKEAILKAFGTGIGNRLRQCELPASVPRVAFKSKAFLSDCHLAQVELQPNEENQRRSFGVTLIDFREGMHAAVAVPRSVVSLSLVSFDEIVHKKQRSANFD